MGPAISVPLAGYAAQKIGQQADATEETNEKCLPAMDVSTDACAAPYS